MGMRKIMACGVALALAGTWAHAGDIPKEKRSPGNLTITADLDFISVWRSNLIDFSDDRVLTSRSATGTGGKTATKTAALYNDNESATWTKLDLNFHADLGKDAYAAFKARAFDINNRTFGTQDGVGSQNNATLNPSAPNEFEVELREAYAHLDNFLANGLGFRLGVQEMNYGLDRGNGTHFLLATGDLQHRFQLRDGGNVDRSFADPYANGTSNYTAADFMAIRDFANPGFGWKFMYTMDQGGNTLGFDVLWTQLSETGAASHDHDLFGVFANYGFELAAKEKSVVTAHFVRYSNDLITTEEDAGAQTAAGTRLGNGSDIWAWGAGAQVRWENVEVFGEFDLQSGDFNEDAQNVAGYEEDHSGTAWYVGGKYTFAGMMGDMTPWLEASLWSYSGDDDAVDRDNDAYINYGSVHETLIVEDNLFGMGLSNNYSAWRIKGGVDLDKNLGKDIGLEGEKTITVGYHMFEVNEDKIVAANTITGVNRTEDDLGDEWDITLRWGYRENISFTLGLGWFMPGDYVSENLQLGAISTGGTERNDDTVTLYRFDASFRF